MDFREKAAIIVLAVMLYETACSKCMPQSLRGSPFERYINKQRYGSNIPTTHENGKKTHRLQDDLTKQNKFYSKISPIDVSDSFINNLKREKRMKRKLQQAQKIYTRDNDEALTIPATFNNQGPPFYLSEVGLFPEVQYPLTASDTWTPNYWNSLPSNNHDRFFKKDAYFTGFKKPNTDNDVFKKPLTAKINKSSAIVKKSEEILKRENIKKSTGTKSNKIIRQTTATQGQKKNVDSFEPKDENDIEKYLMETPKPTEKNNVSTESNQKLRNSKKKQNSNTIKELNQNISNDKINDPRSKENNRKIKKQNIIMKDEKTNASIEKIYKTVPQEKNSKVTEQTKQLPYKNKDPESLSKIVKTFSPKTKEKTHMEIIPKKPMSSIKEVTSQFSKLITKLEQLSNEHKITSTNQIIRFPPTNGTSDSANQEEEQDMKVPPQTNLTNIFQVETKISKENMEAPRVKTLNLAHLITDSTITSDEGAQTIFERNEEESDLQFSFTDYLVRNQLLDVLSDPKLSISSLRNGIFKILEEIESKSEEESDESSLTGINESVQTLPLMDKYLKEENFKSLLPDHGISCLDKQDSSLENLNKTMLPCTNASDTSSEIIFKNNTFNDTSVDTQHNDNVCENYPRIPDHFVTESLAENLRNVISEPSSSNSLIKDLSEIIRLLTVWNSHTDDSCENVHQTTEIDTIDGYVPITTELSSEGDPKTAVKDHSYAVISDSDGIDQSIKDKTEFSCDIHKSSVMGHLRQGVNYCSTQDLFKPNETDQSKYEDVTNSMCEINNELNALEYSRDDSADYSSKDNYKYNKNEFSNRNMTEHLHEVVANSCENINKYNETEPSYENIAGISKDILIHNVSDGVIYYSIEDIRSFNLTDHSSKEQTENLCEDVHKPYVNSCGGVINDLYEDSLEINDTDDSYEDKIEYSKDINKPNTTIYSCEDAANCSYEQICEHYPTCYSSETVPNYSCEDSYNSSDENVADTCHDIDNPDIIKYSNEDSLKLTVISSEGVDDNSYEEISKFNVTDQSNEDVTEYSCEIFYKHNTTVNSSEDTSEHFFRINKTKYSIENIAGTREDITKPNVNDYSNESVVDNSYQYISTPKVTDNNSNEDESKNSWKCIHQTNATVYSCEDVTDCSYEDISSNVTNISNEEVTNFPCEHIHKSIITKYSNGDETEFSSEDKPNSMVDLNEGVIDYSDKVIDEHNVTDYSNETLADYSCDDVESFAIDNSNEVTNIPCLHNAKFDSNVTDHSNEILNNFSSEDISISNVMKRKVKNMAKLNMLEHDTEDTEKHSINNYFSETIAHYASNDLIKPNTTNYMSEVLPNALENISKANVDDLKEEIPESSGAKNQKEDFEIVSDSPTIYHIPFEKLTYATNDISIDVDDQTVSDKVTEDSLRTSHRDLSYTTPHSVSPSFTYEVNEEIPETELVTFEKFHNITSTKTISDKKIIGHDNLTADFLPVFTCDDVTKSPSNDAKTPIAFVSTYLPSFGENILKLHNETETEIFENYLPTIPNRDTKTYDEVCPIKWNESSENQHFMIDDLAHFNDSRCFTNDKEDLLNPFTNNITELFGDKENPDFYDFILYPEEYEYTEASENNDTRELNSDTTPDFTDYTVLPEDTTFTENSEENYIETLATTISPFDQYEEVPEQNAESNISEDTSKSNQMIHNVGNPHVTQGTPIEPYREIKSSTEHTSLSADPKLTRYFDDIFGEQHVFRPLYERNSKPLLHRDFVQHHEI